MPAAPPPAALFKASALAVGVACAATLAASVLLAISAVAERLSWASERYDALLDTVTHTRLASELASVERELEAFETALVQQAIPAAALSLATIGPLIQGFQQASHHLYFYSARQKQLLSYPAYVPKGNFQPETRPWFKSAASGAPRARWTEPYSEFNSGDPVVSRVKAMRADNGELIGILVVDLPLSTLQASLERARGRGECTMLIRLSQGHQILAATVNDGGPVDAARIARAAPLGDTLGVLQHGLLRRQQLADPAWEAVLYLPPEPVQQWLANELRRHAAPMLGLLSALLLAFGLLARRVWHERQLLAEALDAIHQGRKPATSHARQRLWLMDEPLRAMSRLARQVDDDRHQARHDALTKLPNRRAFESDLDSRVLCGERFALLSIDIDCFKQINDSHGHAVGDVVLRRVSAALRDCPLPLTLYRIGGDEFAALLDDGAELQSVCDALLERVRALIWREPGTHITISIGAADSLEAEDRDHLLALADARLYLSKQGGRDRASLSGEPPAQRGVFAND